MERFIVTYLDKSNDIYHELQINAETEADAVDYFKSELMERNEQYIGISRNVDFKPSRPEYTVPEKRNIRNSAYLIKEMQSKRLH